MEESSEHLSSNSLFSRALSSWTWEAFKDGDSTTSPHNLLHCFYLHSVWTFHVSSYAHCLSPFHCSQLWGPAPLSQWPRVANSGLLFSLPKAASPPAELLQPLPKGQVLQLTVHLGCPCCAVSKLLMPFLDFGGWGMRIASSRSQTKVLRRRGTQLDPVMIPCYSPSCRVWQIKCPLLSLTLQSSFYA